MAAAASVTPRGPPRSGPKQQRQEQIVDRIADPGLERRDQNHGADDQQ